MIEHRTAARPSFQSVADDVDTVAPKRRLTRVPLVPQPLLRSQDCFVPNDTRFRAAARLGQSLWRQVRGLPIGLHRVGDRADGEVVSLGSRLDDAAGRQGANFISPAVHTLVRREVALCEDGALIETERLTLNLLSSTALTFNLLGPLALAPKLATAVFRYLLPAFVHTVERIRFETSPGRGDPRFLGDYSAFDAALEIVTPDGEPGTVYLKIKFTENLCGPAATARPRYDDVSRELGLYNDPDTSVLRTRPIEQFWRLHMLAGLAVQHAVTPRALFVTISPSLNRRTSAALALYAAELVDPTPADDRKVGFVALTLEAVVAALASAGDQVTASALDDRYLDLQPVLDFVLNQDFGPPPASPVPGFVALPAPAPAETAIVPTKDLAASKPPAPLAPTIPARRRLKTSALSPTSSRNGARSQTRARS